MEKPWGYHGEWSALEGSMAKTLGACGPSGFGLGTSLGCTPFTMIPPRLFQIMYQSVPENTELARAEKFELGLTCQQTKKSKPGSAQT